MKEINTKTKHKNRVDSDHLSCKMTFGTKLGIFREDTPSLGPTWRERVYYI